MFHPPTRDTTGLPVEERESVENIASADVRPYFERADESVEAERGSNSAKTGHNLGTTALAVGFHKIDAPKALTLQSRKLRLHLKVKYDNRLSFPLHARGYRTKYSFF